MNKILLLVLGLSFNLQAYENDKTSFGRITDLKGSGFISYKGKTREISKGDNIEIGAEIVIEHKGQVSFTDNADHRFHLGNSTSVSVSGNTIELRSGDLWFQSLNKNDDYKIKTVNAMVNYQGGEGILSYDSGKGKTQLMVINSMMKFSNIRAPELNLNISEGHFSFIDNSYDEGTPRDPTPVGEKTYGQLISLFHGISPLDTNSALVFKSNDKSEKATETHEVSRKIASENDSKISVKMDTDSKLLEDYKKGLFHKHNKKNIVIKKIPINKIKNEKNESLNLAVHIYGQTTSVSIKSRAPASIVGDESTESSAESLIKKNLENKHIESNKLMNELKKI